MHRHALDSAARMRAFAPLAAHGMVVRLAGPSRPAPARSASPVHTLTIRGTSLTGAPDTRDIVQLFNVDNTTLLDPQAGAGVLHDGVVKYSVPAGHYFAVTEFGGSGQTQGNRFVVLPQFRVTGDTTVTIRGTAANSKVTMATPRPATAVTTDVWLLRTGRSGPPVLFELYFGGNSVWLSPTRSRPTVGTLRVAANQHLESPAGRAVPYEYTLSYTDPPGIIPPQHYVVHPADLATVHERFYQAAPASGGFAFNGSFPATDTAWTWHTAPAGPATLPAGWTCKRFTRTRDCVVQPMMTLRYRVARLALDGTAPAGRQVLHVRAGHLQAARAAPVTGASVSVSFDAGKTWHRARVTGHGGSYAAVFTAPADALVTLRTSAADAAGGTVTETITSAYRTGR